LNQTVLDADPLTGRCISDVGIMSVLIIVPHVTPGHADAFEQIAAVTVK